MLNALDGMSRILHNFKLTEGLLAAKFEVDAYSCCDGKYFYKINAILYILEKHIRYSKYLNTYLCHATNLGSLVV